MWDLMTPGPAKWRWQKNNKTCFRAFSLLNRKRITRDGINLQRGLFVASWRYAHPAWVSVRRVHVSRGSLYLCTCLDLFLSICMYIGNLKVSLRCVSRSLYVSVCVDRHTSVWMSFFLLSVCPCIDRGRLYSPWVLSSVCRAFVDFPHGTVFNSKRVFNNAQSEVVKAGLRSS